MSGFYFFGDCGFGSPKGGRGILGVPIASFHFSQQCAIYYTMPLHYTI